MENFNYKKATQAVVFFLQHGGGSINKMKALKLVWLSDRLHLRLFGRTITMDSYFAMKNGPVASGTRDLIGLNAAYLADNEFEYVNRYLKNGDKYTIKLKDDADNTLFSDTDLVILNKVQNEFGNYEEFELSEMSHLLPEWSIFKEKLENGGSRFPINKIDFFQNGPFQPKFFDDNASNLAATKSYYQMYQ